MKTLCTKFAPPERASHKKILSQIALLNTIPFLKHLYDSVSDIVLILNQERQMVFANKNLGNFLKIKNLTTIYGQRPGEIFGCIHAHESSGGCGTTEYCKVCGAVNAILNSQKGKVDIRECRISIHKEGEALDLLVHATPFTFRKEKFTIFTIADVGNEKRRRMLERIFFHDVLNTATYLQLASELLAKDSKNSDKFKRIISEGIHELIENINSQKMLSAAENRELLIHPHKLNSGPILKELVDRYGDYAKTNRVSLQIHTTSTNTPFISDKTILLRVLGNMILNAIEASVPDECITIYSDCQADRIRFSVHNISSIPKNTRLQIFQRSFSTKGNGRGLGTYSMRLLSERYLKGFISFESSRKQGTTFTASYPKSL